MAWARTPDSYLLPTVMLEAPDAPWLADAAIGSWSLDRELVASTIPGNIRQRTGLSIGAASLTVRPAHRATPWSKNPVNRISTGIPVDLVAEDATGSRKLLGRWVTDATNGTLSAESIPINLLEAQYAGRDLPQLLPAYQRAPFTDGAPVDPVWPIARLLEQAGFPSFPTPDPTTTLLAITMDGAVPTSSSDAYTVTGDIVDGWQSIGDRTLVAGGSGSNVSASPTAQRKITDRLRVAGILSITFTLDVVGTVYILDLAQQWLVRIVNDEASGTYTIAASNDLTNFGPTQTFTGRQTAAWRDRVQVEIQRAPGASGSWLALHAAARSGPSESWSTTSSHTAAHAPPGGLDAGEQLMVVGGAPVAGVAAIGPTPAAGQFASIIVSASEWHTDTIPGPEVWEPPKAILRPLGGDIGLPVVPAGVDVWQAIQDCASANLAAVILSLDGIATVLNRDDLAGVHDAGEMLDVGVELDDLPWVQDPEDSADRIEVTFTPPTLTNAVLGSVELAPEAWAAADVITVPAGQTITIPAVFDARAAVGMFTTFVVPTAPSPSWSTSSTIIAFDTPDGTGTPIDDSLFTAIAVQTSASTATVKVTNRHTADIYLVDGNGQPHLVLRARTIATFATPQLVARGAAAEVATNPMALDLTPWVQSEQKATSVADYLWGRVAGGGLWKASSVGCRLDWSIDIGNIRRLVHAGTGLEHKVLITKVPLAGSAGEITQSLDLVLIPWTFADFAAAWPSTATFADFAASWGSTATFADFATDPLRTGA